MSPKHSTLRRLVPALVLLVFSFAVYCATLAPTITWAHHAADGGDLITAAHTFGVAHPPGYPTYVLLGKLFTLLPLGDVAFRLNLMSAVFASASVVLTYLTLLILLPQTGVWLNTAIIAAASALLLAFSHTFWSQAIVAEVYSLNAFFVALMIYLVTLRCLRPSDGSAVQGDALLWALSFVAGLALGNHLSALLLLPGVLFLLVRRGHVGPKNWLIMAGFFLLGLSVYLYLPWRAAQRPPVNWGDARSWSGFWWTVSATIYGEYLFGLPLVYLPGRLANWASMLGQHFTWPGLALGLLGIWHLWDHKRDYLAFSVISFAAVVIYALMYNTTDSYVYLIPSYLLFTLWIGCGAYSFLRELVGPWLKRRRGLVSRESQLLSLTSLALLLLPVFLLLSNYSSLDLSKDRSAYEYASQVFADIPSEALVIADTDAHIFALWYFRYVVDPESEAVVLAEGLIHYPWYRENVRWRHPQIVMPSGDDDPYEQLFELIDNNLPQRPVYLTDADDKILARYPYTQVGPLYRLGG